MKSVIVLLVVVSALISCKNVEKEVVASEDNLETAESKIDDHTSQNSLDWAGEYEGTIPCADCEAIKVSLQLREDNTYILSETYFGTSEKDNEVMRNGEFQWDDSGSKITLKHGDSEMQYKVGENQLLMLDTEGNIIDGKISDLYILKKIAE